MGVDTSIEWCTHTFNPWIGCVAVSPACDHCYAEAEAKRRGWAKWGKDEPRHFTSDQYWKAPLTWHRKAEREGVRNRVFCGSLCDVMEDRRDLDYPRARLFDLISHTWNLDWLLLTKRPQNYHKFLPLRWKQGGAPNVWGMTTVESSDYLWRIERLLQVDFAVYGLSMEPLLGPVILPTKFLDLGKRAWVIAGGESGHHARQSSPEWFRFLRDQCVEAGVPFLFKQWGQWCDTDQMPYDTYRELDANGHDPGLYSIGKKAAGRLLDGRTWDEVPQVAL